MQKILKNKKGSISLFVLLSALFFLVIVTAVAVSLKNKETSVDSQIAKVKASYEKDVGNEEQVYNEEISKTPKSNLTSEELVALQTNGIEEIPNDSITIDDLKDTDKIKAVITGDVPIPVDATYLEGTVDTGVVIEYKGSEFVWVPVPVTEGNNLYVKGTTKPMARVTSGKDSNNRDNYQAVLYNYSGTGDSTTSTEKTSYGQDTTSYKEPAYLTDSSYADASSYNIIGITEVILQQEYNKMVESVSKYGGFFVGRYETSISDTSVASVADVVPMSADSTSGNMWYGLYDKQSKFTINSDIMQSSMVWGSQWDAMLNWVLTGADKSRVTSGSNATHNNTYTATTVKTRTTTENDNLSQLDIINNIYDLEGNLYEWTQEGYNTKIRNCRGGSYSNGVSPSVRNSYEPYYAFSMFGSRMSLYIKND